MSDIKIVTTTQLPRICSDPTCQQRPRYVYLLAMSETDMMMAFMCLTHARVLEEDLKEDRPLRIVPSPEAEEKGDSDDGQGRHD